VHTLDPPLGPPRKSPPSIMTLSGGISTLWLINMATYMWGVEFADIMEGKLSSCGMDYILSEYLPNRFNMIVYRQVK
jgi:hypothetical protein